MLVEKKDNKRQSKAQNFQGIGEGIKAYSEDMHGTSSAFPNCEQKRKYTENVFRAKGYFYDSYSELTEHKSKKSGLGVNLGFVKFGHKKEEKSMHHITSKTVNFVAKSYRKGDLVILDTGDFDELMSSHSKKMSQEDFYRNYGAYYINSIQTGYYVNIYISIECQSEKEAEGIKKEMELKLKTEDGSGDLSSENSNDFVSYVNQVGAKFDVEHNLPDSAFTKPKYTDITEAFNLLFLVETLSTADCNSIMSSTVKLYPSLNDSEYAFTGTTLDDYKNVEHPLTYKTINMEFNYCNYQLSAALEYQKFTSNFEKVEGIEKIIEYYYDKLELYRTIVFELNENPWADISKHYNLLVNSFKDDPDFKLRPIQFEIGYVLNETLGGAPDRRTALQKLKELDHEAYCPKIIEVTSGTGSPSSQTYHEIALYAKYPIDFPDSQPSSSTHFKTLDLNMFITGNELCKGLVKSLNETLTPWQYSFASIILNCTKSGFAGGFFASIIYPDEA